MLRRWTGVGGGVRKEPLKMNSSIDWPSSRHGNHAVMPRSAGFQLAPGQEKPVKVK